MIAPQEAALAAIEQQLAEQNEQFQQAMRQLSALGDHDFEIEAAWVEELENAAHPKTAGSVPFGFTRA